MTWTITQDGASFTANRQADQPMISSIKIYPMTEYNSKGEPEAVLMTCDLELPTMYWRDFYTTDLCVDIYNMAMSYPLHTSNGDDLNGCGLRCFVGVYLPDQLEPFILFLRNHYFSEEIIEKIKSTARVLSVSEKAFVDKLQSLSANELSMQFQTLLEEAETIDGNQACCFGSRSSGIARYTLATADFLMSSLSIQVWVSISGHSSQNLQKSRSFYARVAANELLHHFLFSDNAQNEFGHELIAFFEEESFDNPHITADLLKMVYPMALDRAGCDFDRQRHFEVPKTDISPYDMLHIIKELVGLCNVQNSLVQAEKTTRRTTQSPMLSLDFYDRTVNSNAQRPMLPFVYDNSNTDSIVLKISIIEEIISGLEPYSVVGCEIELPRIFAANFFGDRTFTLIHPLVNIIGLSDAALIIKCPVNLYLENQLKNLCAFLERHGVEQKVLECILLHARQPLAEEILFFSKLQSLTKESLKDQFEFLFEEAVLIDSNPVCYYQIKDSYHFKKFNSGTALYAFGTYCMALEQKDLAIKIFSFVIEDDDRFSYGFFVSECATQLLHMLLYDDSGRLFDLRLIDTMKRCEFLDEHAALDFMHTIYSEVLNYVACPLGYQRKFQLPAKGSQELCAYHLMGIISELVDILRYQNAPTCKERPLLFDSIRRANSDLHDRNQVKECLGDIKSAVVQNKRRHSFS